MKIFEVIEMADDIKPNAFSDKTKCAWISALEGDIASNIFLMAKCEADKLRYDEDNMDAELLVEHPYDDIYVLWLCAKIDEANGEYEKYANSMQSYNARYKDFMLWFCATYDPAQGYEERE